MFPACTSNFPTIGLLPEVATSAYLHCNPLPQLATCSGLDLETNAANMALRRTTSMPVSMTETFFNPSCFNVIFPLSSALFIKNLWFRFLIKMINIFQQIQPSDTWDLELQNLYNAEFQQGRSTNYSSQLFTGIGTI